MNYNEFKNAIIACAQKEGVSEYDLYYSGGSSTIVAAFEKEIDSFSDTATAGVCFRCIVDGRMGYSNTQKLCQEEAERLVRDAKACAQVIEAEGFTQIFKGSEKYADVPQAAETECDVEKLKELALEIESKTFAADERIDSVSHARASHSMREVSLYNSNGLDLTNRQSGYVAVCGATATDGQRKYIGHAGKEYLEFDKIDIDAIVNEAVTLAVGSIGGKTVTSGQYPVIMSARVMVEVLDCFASIFSADAAQKGMSLLAGKEGQSIAPDIVTIIDDPHHPESSDRSPFDDEGVATAVKTVVENGVLKTLLYDLKSAKKAGVQSTGNGRKMNYAADINVAPFMLYIKPGESTLDQLMQKAGRAIYITELKGLHAGANAVTGDFSLESKGFLVEDGKAARPAEQFTVAGNFFQMMKDISALGNDFEHDGCGSPSVLISNLSIAGEK